MKNLIFATSLLGIMSLVSCDEEVTICSDNSITVTVEDWTGFDGCGIVLTSDSLVFEVLDWTGNCDSISAGDQLCIEYEEIPAASICMVGPTINVLSCEFVE